MTEATHSFPKLAALTARFTNGAPTSFAVSSNGQRIAYLQSTGPQDSAKRLLLRELSDPARAVVIADPAILDAADARISADEQARRERLRESGTGIVSFATDTDFTTATFALSGALGVADLQAREAQLVSVTGPVIDPRVDPTGKHVAWVADRSLYVANLDGSDERCLAASTGADQSWGLANFLAAEEFDRIRGFWWAPDGQSVIVEEVDESGVQEFYISDPTTPSATPRRVRYPAAGTPNPVVRLWLVSIDGHRSQLTWDTSKWEYVVSVSWTPFGPALVVLYDRSQTNSVTLVVDPDNATTQVLSSGHDDQWVSDLPGTPCWDSQGRLVTTQHEAATEGIAIAGRPVENDLGANVCAVIDVAEEGLLLSVAPSPTSSALLFVSNEGDQTWLTAADGFHTGTWSGGTLVTASTSLESLDWDRALNTWSPGELSAQRVTSLESLAMRPPVTLHHELISVGSRELNTVVIWPANHRPGSARLPVIMNPYGGPHAQRVIEVGRAFALNQWMANQGFAVVVADGRGSPGRGPEFERTIKGDLATPALDDQIDVIGGVAARYPEDIDPNRVGIVGWSFGGYLAALAVMAAPEVFHAAVAGAPVTDWRLYDTAYTERYLSDPAVYPEHYEASSLLNRAANLTRPLMIIHGLADDNVLVAHSLQLSSALTAAGRPHSFLPLSNVTHMTPQVEIAENLQLLEIDFLRRALNTLTTSDDAAADSDA